MLARLLNREAARLYRFSNDDDIVLPKYSATFVKLFGKDTGKVLKLKNNETIELSSIDGNIAWTEIDNELYQVSCEDLIVENKK